MSNIPIENAAMMIAADKRVTPEAARKALVGGLIRGEIFAWAESYWATAQVGGSLRHYLADHDPVPVEFWRPGHALQHPLGDPGCTWLPTGAAGNYRSARFSSRFVLTARTAAARFSEWAELAEFGDMPALLEWWATGVTVARCDVDRLLERRNMAALIRAATTAPPLLPARGSAADFERLMARFVIWAARNADHALAALQSRPDLMMIAQSLADGDIDVRKIRRFVDQIIEEK